MRDNNETSRQKKNSRSNSTGFYLILLSVVLAILGTSIAISNTSQQYEDQSIVLFRKYSSLHSRQNKQEAPAMPEYNIKLKFVTQHFAPVRNCSIKIKIQDETLELNHDSNGVVEAKGQFKSNVSEDTVSIQVDISSGEGENILANSVQKVLTRSTDNANLYQLQDQIIYKPNLPKEAHLIGRVVDEAGVPIPNAKLSISIYFPVFQDYLTAFTDANGDFDVIIVVEQLNPIYGDLSIEATGFQNWNIKKNTEYTEGFYLMNHLQFKFKEDIILKRGAVQLSLEGVVIEHRNNKNYRGAQISMTCQGTQENNKSKQFTITPSDENGHFGFLDQTSFQSDKDITCTIITSPRQDDNTSLQSNTIVVHFLQSSNYKVDTLTIYLTTQPIKGYIKGSFISELGGEAIPDLSLKYVITSNIKIETQPFKTGAQGEFMLDLVGYKDEQIYEGYIIIDSDVYDNSVQYPATIKESDSFQLDLGVLKAKFKPKPISINIQGVLLESTLRRPLPDYDLSIVITYSNKKVDIIESKSNEDGQFSYILEGKSSENYVIEIKTKSSDRFQELTEGNKRELGPNKPNKFDANFKQLLIKRVQTFGKISGYLYDESTNKPIDQALITVETDIPLPPQEIKCTINSNGNFSCEFVVEKYLTYQATVALTTEYGMTGKVEAGELSMANNYTIIGLRGAVKFEIIPQKGLITGQVINGETNSIITEGFYKILSIDPPIDNPENIINKEVPYEAEGMFKIELDLHVGPKYLVKVEFASLNLVKNIQLFELNFKNKYTLLDLKVYLGIPLNGEINGHIKSKLFFPIKDAIVKVYVENSTNPFTAISDDKGYYKVKIPAASTEDVVKATLKVEKERFEVYSEEVSLEKKTKFINDNHDIILTSKKWKSSISGKIIDEMNIGVPFCSLSLVIKDSFKEPTTSLPYTTVSNLTGDYIFVIDVTYDDIYMSLLQIKCNFFIDRKELIELNNQNEYSSLNRVSKMERHHISLIFAGTVLNSLNQPVPNTEIEVLFDYDSHSHGVQDEREVTYNGKYDFKQTVLMGYTYKAKAEIRLQTTEKAAVDADYENFSIELEFNPSNNYKIYKDIEIKKRFVDCSISGTVTDNETKQGIKDCYVALHFTQKEFSSQTVFVYSEENGTFKISTKVQEGFEYLTSAEGKCKGYKDGQVDITLSKTNSFQVSDIQIILTKPAQTDYTSGFIHGHSLSIIGEPLANSQIQAYSQVDPATKYTVTTDQNGSFALPDINFIKGNVYPFIILLTPSDPNFSTKQRKIHLTQNDDYQYNNLTMAAERISVSYNIKGKIIDQNSGSALGGTYVTVSFINQLMIQNSYGYTNSEGEFLLTGKVAKGLNYNGKLVIIHAGYETLTPQFTLEYAASSDNSQDNYIKNDSNFSLVMNPFQKLYYVDERNVIPIRSKVYEKTTCRLYPNKYLPFVKVSLYIEKQQGQEGILIAETYTDLKGSFEIDAPRPLFSDLQTYLVFERNNYMQLKEYQRITPNAQYVEQGPQQINNKQGVSNCSKRQRKIQNKFDKS